MTGIRMIDEELYQQAADELNSDARRPHLWARACALASDDHDEARFLYTNLRVEELLAARKASPVDASRPSAGDTGRDDDVELALTPLDGEAVAPPPVARPGADGTDGVSFEDTAFDALPDDTDGSAGGERGRDLPDLDEPAGPSSAGAAFTADPDPHDRTPDDASDDGFDLVPGGTGTEAPDGSDAPDPERSPSQGSDGEPAPEAPTDPLFDATLIDEPHWLDEELVLDHPAPDTPPEASGTNGTLPDRSDEPLDAVESYGQRTDTVDVPEPAAGGMPVAPDGRAAEGRDRRQQAYEPAPPSSGRDPMPGTLDPVAAPSATSDRYDDREPIVDLDGTGPVWALYEDDDGRLEAVRRGVSWGAMLLTLPWLMWRGLLGTAFVYALLWVVSLGGLLVSGLAWADAGAAASPILRGICAGFALVALIGLVIVPFLRANRWRETAWQRRGRSLVGEVRTGSAALAKRRVLDA